MHDFFSLPFHIFVYKFIGGSVHDLLHVFKYSPLFYGMEVSLNSDGSLSWQYDLRKSIAGDICMYMETLFKIQVSDLAWIHTFFAYAHM